VENNSEGLVSFLNSTGLGTERFLSMLKFLRKIPADLLWFLCVFPVAVIVSLSKINLRLLIITTVCGLLLLIPGFWWPEVQNFPARLATILCSLMLLKMEYDRMSTRYVLTDRRLIFLRGCFNKTNRTLFYTKIDDLFLNRSLAGRIFGYGTIIPLTSSQIGTGNVSSFVGAGGGAETPVGGAALAAGFGKARQTISESPEYSLYCVPNVERVYNYIVMRISRREGDL
jgi:hypothetical protein